MDVNLVCVVVGLTTFLANHLPSPANQSLFVKTCLGLSFSLFALGVLDATPPSWNLVLGHDQAPIAVSTAYRFILWAIAILVVLVGPGKIGSHLSANVVAGSGFVPKYWVLQLMYQLLQKCYQIVKIATSLIGYILFRSWRRRRSHASSLPVHRAATNREKKTVIFQSLGRFFRHIVGSLMFISVTSLVLLWIGPVVIRIRQDTSALAQVMSALSAVGILLSALLNGFGSVSMPYSCLAGLCLPQVHSDAVAAAERELSKARASLDDRRAELLSNGKDTPSSVVSNIPSSSWGVTRKSSFSEMGDALTQRRKQLLAEIDFLQSLIDELGEDLIEMRHSRAVAAVARTPMGVLRSWVGVIFSIVLLLRLVAASLSIWTAQRSNTQSSVQNSTDPVTVALLWLTGYDLVSHDYYNTLSQCTSLVLTAVLSFSQVRMFLQTIHAVNRRLSHWYHKCYCKPGSLETKSENNHIKHYLIASLMTCYCLACSVLIKKMLPNEYRSSYSEALGGSEIFHVRPYPVNVAFCCSAVVSAAVLGALLGIQRQNSYRYMRNIDSDDRSLASINTILDP